MSRLIYILIGIAGFCTAQAQPAVQFIGSGNESLAGSNASAIERGRRSDGAFWVGYHIEKLMDRQAYVGAGMTEGVTREGSLYNLLGKPEKFDETLLEIGSGWRFKGTGVFRLGRHASRNELHDFVLKEIGILVMYDPAGKSPVRVVISNLSLPVDLEGAPLFWLGRADPGESVELLAEVFEEAGAAAVKEDVLDAAGMHGVYDRLQAFLMDVIEGEHTSDVRKKALYWLGQQDTAEAFEFLRGVYERDPSRNVREEAVFSISQMSLPAAQDFLIDQARREEDPEIRKVVIFWLSQIASEKSLALVEEVIESDEDTRIQEHAVFALAQFGHEVAVPRLIDIAHTHPSLGVRKKAIFWLGDTGDPRAVEALIEIVRRQQ